MPTLTKLLRITAASLSLASCLAVNDIAVAQNYPNSQTDNYQPNEYDTLNGTSGLNPMELIHRARLGTSRTSQEFQEDSSENLNNAADDFKRQQQELLEHQATPENNVNN